MSTTALRDQGYSMSKVWRLALNASWGSFIFGYNIGVFTSSQPNVSATLGWGSQKDLFITMMSSFVPLGAMFGALSSSYIAKKYGRRKSLMLIDILTFIGAGIIVVPFTATFAIGRLVNGFCAGSFACLVPLYINETAPLEVSGKVGGIVQFQVTFGIVISYALALILPTGSYNSNPLNYVWVALFAFQALFALIQLLVFTVSIKNETPGWLIEKGKYDEALNSLKDVYDEETAAKILRRLEDNNKKSMVEMGVDSTKRGDEEPSYSEILMCKNKLGKMIRLGCFINFFQQFSGINAILTYSTAIFANIGGGLFLSRVFTLIVGIVNMASTLAVFPLIEKAGRKKLVMVGGIGMTVCLFCMGFFSGVFQAAGPAPPIIFIMLFIVFFEGSIGPICWIYCGEILPARAMSVCIFVNWFSAFIVILTFNIIVSAISMSGAFFLYAGLNLLGTIYFCFDMVETKGLDKAEIRKIMTK
jgi:MFS transporter, SP family, major inositol transporter